MLTSPATDFIRPRGSFFSFLFFCPCPSPSLAGSAFLSLSLTMFLHRVLFHFLVFFASRPHADNRQGHTQYGQAEPTRNHRSTSESRFNAAPRFGGVPHISDTRPPAGREGAKPAGRRLTLLQNATVPLSLPRDSHARLPFMRNTLRTVMLLSPPPRSCYPPETPLRKRKSPAS